jgi:hypothetical protein
MKLAWSDYKGIQKFGEKMSREEMTDLGELHRYGRMI